MNKENALVSWLIPIYNCEKTLVRAMESMLAQTYQNFEIVIVLEYCCNNETVRICTSYAEKYENIRIINNKDHLGIAKSLNVGIRNCRGKYIARMDSDDYSYPDRLEKQVSFMEKNRDVDILGGNAVVIDESNNRAHLRYTYELNSERIKAHLLFGMCFMHPTLMIRNNIEGLEYPIRCVEDYGLLIELLPFSKMAILPDVLIDYYQGNENTSLLKFDEVRKDSAEISRKAILNILNINTCDVEEFYFGWRTQNDVDCDVEKLLISGLNFYKKVLAKNDKIQKINSIELRKVVNFEWRKTLDLIYPFQFPQLYRDVSSIEIDDICELFRRLKNERQDLGDYIVYGTGHAFEKWYQYLSEKQKKRILCFCDSNEFKQRTVLHGKRIVGPQDIKNFNFDYIAIASFDFIDEITKTLINWGFSKDVIKPLPLPENTCSNFHFIEKYKKKYLMLDNSKHAFLFCAPDYGNLGDHAIADAEHTFVKENFGLDLIEIPCCLQKELIETIKPKIKENDLIFVTGGGFLGSLWHEGEDNVRNLLLAFPHNDIFIFPQTIFWENDKKTQKFLSQKIYADHKGRITICARDRVSKRIMDSIYSSCTIIMAPDIVLYKDWSKYFISINRHGVLVCLKDDKESILTDKDKNEILNIIETAGLEYIENKNEISGRLYENERREMIIKQLQMWAGSELVITDRLHGLIFSVITNTPCIVFDNCNHKLNTAIEWFTDFKWIIHAKDVLELREIIKKIHPVDKTFDSTFYNQYKKIIINSIRNYMNL